MDTPTLPPQPTHTDDETAIRDLLRRLMEAWNRGDGNAYAAQFTEDADYIAPDGTHLQGRQATAQLHQRLFDTVLQGSQLERQRVKSIRFVTPEVAIVHGTSGVRWRWQSKVTPRRMSIQTYVAVKQAGQWRFTAYHSCRIQRRNWLQSLLLLLGRR